MGGLLKHTNWGSHQFLIAVRREIPAAGKTLANRAKGVGTPGAPPPLCRSSPIVPGGDAFYLVYMGLKKVQARGPVHWPRANARGQCTGPRLTF
eukprot:scaffold532_cov275-Chaetoceros_neogracile.AAC.13